MVQNIQCPNCGANMHFNSEKQNMHCDYCGTELSVEEVSGEEREKEREEEKEEAKEKTEQKKPEGNFKVYKCPSCGAELLTDEYTAATFCNFCGNSSLIEDRLTGELMPEQVIPFKISKEKAKEIYKKWTKKGLLTPKSFARQSTIEKIGGIYVPFWLYDYHSRAKLTAACTRVRREVHGNTEYIHTDNFRVVRDVDTEYLKVPADASKKMPDDIMDKLEPFHYTDMTGFEMPYLSGYSAERYNYSSSEISPRVEARINDYIYSLARDSISGYSTVAVTDQDIHHRNEDAKYTLFPVWMLSYKFNNQNYIIAINGQTGKIVGSLPISKKRSAAWFFGITIVLSIIFYIIGRLFG